MRHPAPQATMKIILRIVDSVKMDPTQSELEETSVKKVDTTRGSNPGSSLGQKLVDLTTDCTN